MIFDSNLIIYAVKKEHERLSNFIANASRVVSTISEIEVLGYGNLDATEEADVRTLLSKFIILEVDSRVVQRAIAIRRSLGRRIGLGDLLIAATALVHDLTLQTHNVHDFRGIPGLKIHDPLLDFPNPLNQAVEFRNSPDPEKDFTMSASASRGKLAIVVGGGPAPGINGVISSVTIEAINQSLEVYGIRDGFTDLILGDVGRVQPLDIAQVAQYYMRGGSMLGTARTNPAKKDEDMKKVLGCFEKLGINYLVTIGGDDTAFSGSQVYKRAGGKIRVAHVPKTIDNDLPLPPGVPTFGFETARHLGVQLARNLHEDAKTTSRWYIIVSMGRAAGHLALGIGKASASAVTIISEEYRGRTVTLDTICDLVIGAMIKRRAQGKKYGLAVLSEGLLESIGEEGLLSAIGEDELKRYGDVVRDDHGHLRLGEIEFGRIIKDRVGERLKALGLKITIIDKDLGYELRCADPIPFDSEYTRNLGFGAVKFLLSPLAAKFGAIVSFVEGKLHPLPFDDMIDPATQRMRARLVDVTSENYECARRYMIRLEKEDFADDERLSALAAVVKMTPEQFKKRFEYVVG